MRKVIVIAGTIIVGMVLNQLALSYSTGMAALAVTVAIGAIVLYAIQKASKNL